MKKQVNKTVKLDLAGLNGNAFYLMGVFQRTALRQGWTQDEVNVVLDEAKEGDYDHLLGVLMNYCSEPDDSE